MQQCIKILNQNVDFRNFKFFRCIKFLDQMIMILEQNNDFRNNDSLLVSIKRFVLLQRVLKCQITVYLYFYNCIALPSFMMHF